MLSKEPRNPATTELDSRPLILHVRSAVGKGGGPEKTILSSPRYYDHFGYRATCVYLHPPGDSGIETLRQRAELAGAPFAAIPDRGPFDWKSFRLLYRLCRERKVAIWHGHDYKTDMLGQLVRWFWPMRLVSTVHGWITNTRRERWYKAFDKWSLRSYEDVVCVSENLREECLRSGIKASACHFIPNGIDTLEFQRVMITSSAKTKLGLNGTTLLIGAVGRLSDEKGFDLLIQAVDILLSKGCDVLLWIAGEGPARPRLEHRIETCMHKGKIRLLGHIDDPKTLFQAMDIFVLSSFTEGLPNAVLEAMAFGTPVVATSVGGIPSLIEERENGLLVPPGNVDELIRAVVQLVENEALRERLGTAGRQTVENRFSLQHRMKKVCALYDQLLSPGGSDATMTVSGEAMQ